MTILSQWFIAIFVAKIILIFLKKALSSDIFIKNRIF